MGAVHGRHPMEMSVTDLLSFLENDLADFYARIKILSRFGEAKEVFQRIAEQIRLISADDRPVGETFDQLVDDEMQHRDAILEAAQKQGRKSVEGKPAVD